MLTGDITFRAHQHRNNPDFRCDGDTPTPTPEPTPTPLISCTDNDIQYAVNSSNENQGTQKGGAAILANRSIPSAMFGAPQTTGTPSDAGFPAGSFYSLGFTGGNIVVGFDEPFYPNPAGDDINVFEVTGGVYPDENVTVEVASNPAGPWTLASPNPGLRDAGFEMNTASAQYIRLTEASNIALFNDSADGYDVDAVRVNCKLQAQ